MPRPPVRLPLRFLQQDPAGMAASGPNPYGYTGGNPTNYVDRSSTFAQALALPRAVAAGTVSLPALFVGAAAALAVFGIVAGVGYGLSQLSGPAAYTGDTGGMLGWRWGGCRRASTRGHR